MMRIGYFDTAKGVGMLLVIISHTFPSGFGIQWFCESFHMPLFFFISGFFFSVERYSVKEFLQRRFKQLIIPLACFSIIVGLIYTVCYGNLVIRKFVLPDTLWFLWVLFIVEVLYMLLMRLCGSVYSILIVSVSVFMCSQLKTVSFPDPFYVKALGNAFCFYSIGNMFSKYKLKIGFNSYNESCCKIGLGGKLFSLAIVLFSFITIFGITYRGWVTVEISRNIMVPTIPAIMVALMGILATFNLAIIIELSEAKFLKMVNH